MVCLDTSFIIDVLRGHKQAVAKMAIIEQRNEAVMIAAPTIIELIRGFKSVRISENQRDKIEEFIESMATLALDKRSAVRAGNIELELIRKGVKTGIEDVMIGAICIANREKLVTRNEKHFSRIKGLEVEGY